MHTHSTGLVALTLQGVWGDEDILPPITPYFVMKVGHVPLIAYHRPGRPGRGRRGGRAHRGAPRAARRSGR
jgi:ribulose-5-phosphate 4-epimerase/fuculose-1-phosphate aldolase